MGFSTISPSTLKKIADYDYLSGFELEVILEDSLKAFEQYQSITIEERVQLLFKFAEALRKNSLDLSQQMALEMGKPLRDAQTEVEKCAGICEYYAKNGPSLMADEMVSAQYEKTFIRKNALGPLLCIMPWNYPLLQVIRFAAPSLILGNSIVLKHSDIVAGFAEKLEKIFFSVYGSKIFQNLRIDHEQAAKVIADARIKAVTLTGSSRAGKTVAEVAGKYLKKTVLELGGSDPYLVLADADLDLAAKICAEARLINNGQSCIAAKRFFIDKKVYKSFLERFYANLQSQIEGDPFLESTQRGPLAQERFKTQLESQCESLEKKGAQKLLEKSSLSEGAYFPLRVYEVDPMLAFVQSEELFGPVALVAAFDSEQQALSWANASLYGLGGALFSKDQERALNLSKKMQCGFVTINAQVKSDARIPFGGVKSSGYGRELGHFGFYEFSNIQSVGVGASALKG